MLEQQNYVAVFKLSSSEEIICTVVEETEDHYVIEKVRAVAPQQGQNGQIAVGWMPFMWMDQTGDTKMELYKDGRMVKLTDLPDAIEKEYLSKTSGIAIAGAGQMPQG